MNSHRLPQARRLSSAGWAAAALLACPWSSADAGEEAAFHTWYGYGIAGSATSGGSNVLIGSHAGGPSNADARFNVFVGYRAGASNVNGQGSTFVGAYAGASSSTGLSNSFFGSESGYANTYGSYNVFAGRLAGHANTSGNDNAFFGTGAGNANTTAHDNSFFGSRAGFTNTTGTANTFLGRRAGYNSSTGNNNTFVGHAAGESNTLGGRNTILGAYANITAARTNATAVGFRAKVSQSNSLVLGSIPGINGTGGSYVAVGMGTDQPAAPLHVKRDVSGTGEMVLLENSADTAANRVMLEMVNNGGSSINFTNSATAQTWILRATGSGNGAFDVYRAGGANLVRVTSAGNMTLAGTLTQNSNVHDKTGIEAVDAHALLGKVQALPISRWRYKGAEAAHVGPMAQDFHAAFGLGDDATKIAPGDMAGVALAAIQAQQRQLARLEAENAALRSELRALAATLRSRARHQGP